MENMIKTDEYAEGSAERALAEFAAMWKKRKWNDLGSKCQITWAQQKGTAKMPAELRARFGIYRLVDAHIGETINISDVTKDIPITIDYEFRNGVAHKTLLARVICESGPFVPDVAGTWGVNPTSMLREVPAPEGL